MFHAVKIEVNDGVVTCVDIWKQDAGPGKCLDVLQLGSDHGFTVIPGGCSRLDGTTTPDEANWTITLAEGCRLWDGAVGIKTGGGNECVPAPSWSYDSATRTITFNRPGQAISHVEIIFCCSS